MNFFSTSPCWDSVRLQKKAQALKILCIMKLYALIFLLFSAGVYASTGRAQTVNLKLKKVHLEDVLEEISKQTKLKLFYNQHVLVNTKPVNVYSIDDDVADVLEKALKGQNLRFEIIDNTIVIREDTKTDIDIKGTVRDSLSTLGGVSVFVEKHPKISTRTDANGQYTLRVPEGSTLIFRYMGYADEHIAIDNQKIVDVTLRTQQSKLDEIVVVGYGVQKKANLTGAVDMITSEQLANRPIASVGAGLQGLIPNLNIGISNGRATTNPTFNIRGYTSINGGSPLILVDNIPYTESEVATINPSDIESVSVLKDAAAGAIYGARGGFGVVLITTKSAKSNKLEINFNTNIGYRTIGKLPKTEADPYVVMDLKTQAARPLYNLYPESARAYAKRRSEDPTLPEVILSDNEDSWIYTGSTHWLKEAYKESAPTYIANLSLAKKADNLSYYLSSEYYQQDGLLKFGNDIYRRYNVRGKVDLDVTDWLKISNNTLLTMSQYDAPVYLDEDFFWNIISTNSLSVPKNPDGSWTSAGASVLGPLKDGGRRNFKNNEFLTTFSASAALLKNIWDLKGDMTFRRGTFDQRSFNVPALYKTGPNSAEQQTFANSWAKNDNTTGRYNVFNLYTDYHQQLGKHFLQALLGYNQEYQYTQSLWTRRDGLLSPSLPSIGTAVGSNISNHESINDWAVQGVFIRTAYNYGNRYLVEFNGRYDGSSRFPKGKRWGFFPSASAGWNLSEEQFFRPIKESIQLDMFKIRGSYGSLGNQASVSEYGYIPTMSNKQVDYILGKGKPQAVYAPGAVSDNFSWESIETVNLGVDLSLLKNRLNINFDKYTRYTNNMLISGKELPGIFGTTVPQENAGDLKTKGWELRLGWRDSKDIANSALWYSINLTLADNRAWITRYDNPSKSLGGYFDRYYVGREIGEIWGADITGYFKSDEDVKDHPNQTAMGTDDQSYKFYAGDPIFADRNGDGKVDKGDGTVDNPGDMYVIGNDAARLPYGVDLSAGWKGFDIRAFVQGIGKRDWYPGASNMYFWGVFTNPWTNPTVQNLDYWTPENPDTYFPAIRAYSAEDSYQQLGIPNNRYLQNGAYLRMKNLTVGYTLPQRILQRAHINKLRFFFSAENVFEISHIKVKLDPESIGPGSTAQAAYPFQRTYTFGLSVSF